MKLSTTASLEFQRLLHTSDATERKDLLKELQIPADAVFACPMSPGQIAGHRVNPRATNQDRDYLPDGVDPQPFDRDANRDGLAEGWDRRLDQQRDVDRDGTLNGQDRAPFAPEIS